MAKVEAKRGLSQERLREFFREMQLIRRFEEKVEERFRAGALPGFLHVEIGQEADVVGGGLPAIAGAVLAFKLRREPRVAVAFFGDGATNIGTFHESLNLAQLWQVPAVYVCENNHYAESTPAVQQLPIRDLAKRAVAFGMHSQTVDGQDVEAVHKAAGRALERARSGKGPVFLLAEIFRLVGHYVGDPQVYRPKGELQKLRETQDPLEKARAKLELSDEELEAMEREVQELVDGA